MNGALQQFWRRMASGRERTMSARLLTAALAPASLLYGLAQYLRATVYRCGLRTVRNLPRPVVSIGNITVGGTGKTPVSAWLARILIDKGYRVAVISRGYGGTLEGRVAIVSDGERLHHTAVECGDEPYLLASTVPGLMVVIGSDRHAAGTLALERLSPDVFLLDDGFQHLRLHRDMNILLLDAQCPFGNGLTLPAGLLREPCSAVLRADRVIHTRCGDGMRDIPGIALIPQAMARYELRDLVPLDGGAPYPLGCLQGARVLAFAGIAGPEQFFHDLAGTGCRLIRTVALADHAAYDQPLIEDLLGTEADYYVTTEKDAVKLRQLRIPVGRRIVAARLGLVVDGEASLVDDLCKLLQK